MSGRKVSLLLGTSSVLIFGLFRWRARKRAEAAAEEAEKMVAEGAMVR